MDYRQLGSSGARVSALGLGGNNFGRRIDQTATTLVVNQALDLGVNHFDSADVYGGGLSEEYLGKALAGRRKEVVLATKTGFKAGKGPNDVGLSYRRVIACCEDSLRRLGTDYIDLYYLHQPDPHTRIEETVRACDDLVRQGKIRYFALSNFPAWQACDVLWVCDRRGYQPPVVTEDHYNLVDRGAESELLPFLRAHGLGLVPYYPLAAGLLAGKFHRGDPIPSEVRGLRSKTIDRWLNLRTFEVIWRLDGFARERGCTTAELAIAWLLTHPEVSSIIAGATRPEQVVANAKASDVRLSAEDVAALDEIVQGDEGES